MQASLLTTLAANPWMLYLYAGVFGLLIGSFLNVVISRVPQRMLWKWKQDAREFLKGEGETTPEEKIEDPNISSEPEGIAGKRSHCPNCGHHISWWENIPLISYVFLLRGKCRGCKQHISLQYPIIEALTGGLFVATAMIWGVSFYTLFAMAFIAILISLAMIDFKTMYLPDDFTYPLLWLGLLASVLFADTGLTPSLKESVIAAMIGYLSLWSIYWIFKIITGKEGLGYGDFKLLAALGAWCGLESLLSIVLIACFTGGIVGAILMKIKGESQPFAFGPYLAIGGLIEFLYRNELLSFIRNMI